MTSLNRNLVLGRAGKTQVHVGPFAILHQLPFQ
jgi:hypothetical protein